MIPLQDDNPVSIRPFVNWTLIIVNVIVFFYTLFNGSLNATTCTGDPNNTICVYGLKPAEVLAGTGLVTFLTSMFLHGDLFHIGGNMLYLYIFGDNIEDLTGHAGYLLFYLVSGVAGSLAHIASDPNSSIPAIGASGAISGVLGAYVRHFPHARVRTMVMLRFWIQFIRVPAYLLIGFWFLYQLILGLLALGGGVAYWAHIGGFLAGLGLGFAMRGRKHPPQYGAV